jgi:hypothetical protein
MYLDATSRIYTYVHYRKHLKLFKSVVIYKKSAKLSYCLNINAKEILVLRRCVTNSVSGAAVASEL